MVETTQSIEIIPNPDPSDRTARYIDASVSALKAHTDSRIDAIDKSIEVQHADLTRVPTLLDRAMLAQRELFSADLKIVDALIGSLRKEVDGMTAVRAIAIKSLQDLVYSKIEELASVTIEKFAGVNSQFMERDTRTDQRAGDTKLAVDAAFAAAKEATAKIEAGFTKQIDGMADVIKAIAKNADDKIGDLKDRITAMEGRAAGMQNTVTERRLDSGALVGLIVAGMMAVSVIVSVLGYVALHVHPEESPQIVYVPATAVPAPTH